MEKRLSTLLFSVPLPHDTRRMLFRLLNPRTYARWQQKRHRLPEQIYSIQPFDEQRCIFVHIPKCAGISVSRSLFGGLVGHMTVREYQLIFSRREFENYFKFTFVRNPWDRLVSAFHFLKEGGYNEANRQWAARHLSGFPDFETFVKQWINERNIMSQRHFFPQYRFICSRDEMPLMDFIGHFENLDNDFRFVQSKLGSASDIIMSNRGRTRGHDYRDYYSPETRDIVAHVYRKDIELLGYDFEGLSGTIRQQ